MHASVHVIRDHSCGIGRPRCRRVRRIAGIVTVAGRGARGRPQESRLARSDAVAQCRCSQAGPRRQACGPRRSRCNRKRLEVPAFEFALLECAGASRADASSRQPRFIRKQFHMSHSSSLRAGPRRLSPRRGFPRPYRLEACAPGGRITDAEKPAAARVKDGEVAFAQIGVVVGGAACRRRAGGFCRACGRSRRGGQFCRKGCGDRNVGHGFEETEKAPQSKSQNARRLPGTRRTLTWTFHPFSHAQPHRV